MHIKQLSLEITDDPVSLYIGDHIAIDIRPNIGRIDVRCDNNELVVQVGTGDRQPKLLAGRAISVYPQKGVREGLSQ